MLVMRLVSMKVGFFFFLLFFLGGCIKNNPDPSWIEITPWKMNANPSLTNTEGELSHNFTDAWVYADGQLVGVFELPIKVPILKEGTTTFRILPTVVNNGISDTKKPYPFVEPYEVEVDLIKNQTVVINPETRHYSEVKFWIEDFEEANVKVEDDSGTLTSMVKGNDPSKLKYGYYYGLVELDTNSNYYSGYTSDAIPLVLPKGGAEVYLEVDYRSTNPLVTGLIEISSANIQNHPNIQINAQDPSTVKWKKIYIDLKELVSSTVNAEYYKISLNAKLTGEDPREIIIDNIKVLHF